ncbi:MAG: nucleoside triphosphate pyrophosphatase [Thermoanaerobaculia bacterium]|nr:nucleoside triphosphate pyrophosphatase [Thermoanaerobaculia bacterium]
MEELVLASGSPRRSELLSALGLRFTVRPVDLDESVLPGEDPAEYVLRLAREKARARAGDGEVVLAADTTVVLDGRILGKPEGAGEARRMLAELAGRWHEVLTGVALFEPAGPRLVADLETTRVRIGELDPARIEWYVGTGEPLDKAGSYAVQGLGALFVEEIRGNYTNVVGLPLPLTARLFTRLGLAIW